LTLLTLSIVKISNLKNPSGWPQKTWAEKWGLLCPFPWGIAGFP